MVYVELEAPQQHGDFDCRVASLSRAPDLTAAVGREGQSTGTWTVTVDGASLAPDELLTGRLRCGSHVLVRPACAANEQSALTLECLAGWANGARAALPTGLWYLAAEGGADWRDAPPATGGFLACSVTPHGTCTLTARDDRTLWVDGGATFGPKERKVGEDFQFAGSHWQVSRAAPAVQPPASGSFDATGVAVFNRRPRMQAVSPPPSLAAPAPPDPYSAHARMSWATLAVPLAMGAAFAWLFGPLMALFALLTPVLVTANWLEDRVRARRHRTRAGARHAEQLRTFAEAVRAAGARETAARRRAEPSLAELIARAHRGDARLWERRASHDDFMRLAIGTTDMLWQPPLRPHSGDAGTTVREADGVTLSDVPVVVDLSAGKAVGIVGERWRRDAAARAMIARAALLHGPADLRVVCVAEEYRAPVWDWLKWLPHTRLDPQSGHRLLGLSIPDIDRVLSALINREHGDQRDAGRGCPLALIVVDGPSPARAYDGLLRDLYGGGGPPVAVLALADTVEALPATCSTILDTGVRRQETPSRARLARATLGGVVVETADAAPSVLADVRVDGTTLGAARQCARALGRFADPEVRAPGAALPASVSYRAAAQLARLTPEAVVSRWQQRPAGDGLPALLGVCEAGAMLVDLVRDGPHALLAGTTGSGKSELLRTLVTSLALTCDPDQVNFVLVDYKGGSAFDACARLPHVVGIVTDLDEQLGRRALTCLEAELVYRERRLREAAAADLSTYRAAGSTLGPLPRLVVVIDEFAALARELPDFMRSLVNVAQRGRSLGVHLVLATQRPTGVVNDQIRANTNLRIALRVQSTADSTDVIDSPAAALLDRGQPGRAFARLGPSDLIPFQCAYVSGRGEERGAAGAVTLNPFRAAWAQPRPSEPPAPSRAVDDASDLERIVEAIAQAASTIGHTPQRAPWPPPLPRSLTLSALSAIGYGSSGSTPADATISPRLGLIDEPSRQRQRPWLWRAEAGSLWACGGPNSGATELLVTLAVAAARSLPVDRLHIYAIDAGGGGLGRLSALPHTGAVIRTSERDRLVRLSALLGDELEHRRTGVVAPRLLLVIDRYDELRDALAGPSDTRLLDRIAQVVRTGHELGLHVALSTQRPGGVPTSVAAALPQRLVFALTDRQDYAAFGLRPSEIPTLSHLRAVDAATGDAVQFAHVDEITASPAPPPAGRRLHGGRPRRSLLPRGEALPRPRPIGTLPSAVTVADVRLAAQIHGDFWTLPVGIGNERLTPVGLRLGEGDHALIVGPARSGKTTALAVLADVARSSDQSLVITTIAPRRSGLADASPGATHLSTANPDEIVAAIRATHRPHLVLIDDAERIEDRDGEIERALREASAHVHVVAAARGDALRSAYAHWARRLRASRQALVLRPDVDADGELFSITLPRDRAAAAPGRGYLLSDGEVELAQCANLEQPR